MSIGKLSKILNDKNVSRETYRNYIGASSIGSQCLRQIWYEYNGYEGLPITPKLRRTSEIGNLLETMILDELKNAGLNIIREHKELIDSKLPYFKGHIDAFWKSENGETIGIIEVKTAKDAQFKQFVKHGLYKWSPKYYGQIQAYMGMSGIHDSYLICLNKDTSETHDKNIKFNHVYYEGLQIKAEVIHDAKEPAIRVNSSPAFYICKMCKFRGVCHK